MIEFVAHVFSAHFSQPIASLAYNIPMALYKKRTKGLVSKETVELRRWGNEVRKFVKY